MTGKLRNFLFKTTRGLTCKPGASRDIGKSLKQHGYKRVMFVTDPGVLKLGLMDATLAGVKQEGIGFEIYDGVKPDPSYTLVEEATAAAKALDADCIVGFGGGSPMDVAKLVACLADPRTTQSLDDIYGVDMISGTRLPLMLVPTTAGTGSEVTMNSIITTTKPGEEPMKKGVVSAQLLPDEAVLDAELTLGLPAHITADTGVDAMVHAIEAYTTRHKKNPISDMFVKEALTLLSRNIRTVVSAPGDVAARSNMLLGACLAGIAFNNAPVGAVHALAYPLGSHFHITHGLSNSLMLPHVVDFNRVDSAGAQLYAELAPFISEKLQHDFADSAQASGAVVQELRVLQHDLGMKTTLTQAGIAPTDVGLLTTEAMKQTRLLPNNIREVKEDDIRAMYTQAL